jgi:hypothetical protein
MGNFPTTVTITYITSPPTVINGITQTATATLPVHSGADYTSEHQSLWRILGYIASDGDHRVCAVVANHRRHRAMT